MRKELRRRLGRTILTALGLAAGVGLVIGIIGVSQGLNDAQGKVLAPLSSIGTDILVTRVAGTTTSASPSPTPTASENTGRFGGGGGGGFFFGGGPGGPNDATNAALNSADAAALLNENDNVVTDLSKLGKPGTKFVHDFFLSATLLSFPQQAVQQVSSLPGVAKAVPGITQLAEHETGTVPNIVATVKTGGEAVTTTVAPPPMTDAERAAFEACLEKSRATSSPEPQPSGSPGFRSGGGGGGFFFRRGAAEQCLPERFQQYQATVIAPLREIQQVVNPPQTDISNTTYTAAGIDPSNPDVGLVTRAQLTSGSWLATGSPDQVLLNVAYANKNNDKVGSTLTINGTTFDVVGLVNPTLTGNTADIYFPLSTLQTMAGKSDRITQILVKATSASDVDKVAAEIKSALPGATVVTTKTLADQVTGSLSDAQKLATRLGGAVGAIVLAAAFAIAVLLTLSSVAKRVREIGTLRAVGWSKSRVVRQVLGETLGIGLLGGIVGVGLGYVASIAVGAFSPRLTATSTGVTGLGSSSLAGLFGQAAQAIAHTSTVALKAPVHVTTLGIGVAFALFGGLLAGVFGGWRAARLSPAEALRTVG
jgi:ABC-type antimicrobial peptide transport system permease subunit